MNRSENRKQKFNKIWKKTKSFLCHLFTVNKGLKAISILLAVLIWLTIVLTTSTTISATASNVPVVIDLTDTAVEKLGLSVINLSEETVKVNLSGNRDSILALLKNPADIKVSGQLNKVNAAGNYEIELFATLPGTVDGVTIQSINPSKINVRFDAIEKKTIPVSVDYSSVKIREGLLCMPAEPSVTSITLQGPATDVAKVVKAVAVVESAKVLETSQEFSVPLILMDENGVKVDAGFMTLEQEEISVVVPVYKAKTVPIKVNFVGNVKEEFLTQIPYTLDCEQIEIAGPPDKIDQVTEIVLTTINLNELALGTATDYELTLPAGFISVENITSIHFAFNPENWTTKTFRVRRIETQNLPEGVSASVLTSVVYNVKVVGQSSVLTKLTADDFICQVDFLDKSVTAGKWNYAATVRAANAFAWATGDYTVTVQIKG